MKKIFVLAFFLLPYCMFAQDARKEALAKDARYVGNGHSIYENGYADQPYILVLPDGRWFCAFTTSGGHEGSGGQHVVCTLSEDDGKTWSEPVKIEFPDGPAASWATPYLTKYGRIYVFYSFNGDKIEKLRGRKIRNDMLGWYCYRYSDDFGKTWSERFRIPLRVTDCDLANDWKGEVQIFWGIDSPDRTGEALYMAFTKLGKYMLENGEGWLVKCANIETQKDAGKLEWQMLPEGEKGIRNPDFGSIQEEHNIVPMSDGGLYCVYRTRKGRIAESYSFDGGKSWTAPKYARYANGREIKNPRACPKLYRAANGKYLLWFHNHSELFARGYANRNPAWVSGGVEKDGKILWSEPEILLHDPYDHSFESGRYSYPDFIEKGGKYWVSSTQKVRARVHEIEKPLLEGLWAQLDGTLKPPADAPAYSRNIAGESEGKMVFPNLESGGFTLELVIDFQKLRTGETFFESNTEAFGGFWISAADAGALKICALSDREYFVLNTDSGSLKDGLNHVVVIFDGLARTASTVVNGRLCDGGNTQDAGWLRLPEKFTQIKGAEIPFASPAVKSVKFHTRAFRVSEAAACFRELKK